MAVKEGSVASKAGVDPQGRRVLIGANVVLTVVVAGAIVAFLQWMGTMGGFVDMTTTSINSLSEPTQKLLSDLDTNVRLTSLYFETDVENEDQKKYRTAVSDLLALYEATNRSKVTRDAINPLQDHEKRRAMLARLKEKSRFKEQVVKQTAAFDAFRDEVQPKIGEWLNGEMSLIEPLSGGLGGGGDRLVAQIRQMLSGLQQEMDEVQRAVTEMVTAESPTYSQAKSELRQFYDRLHKNLETVAQKGPEYALKSRNTLGQPEVDFLSGAGQRYRAIMEEIASRRDELDKADRVELEDVLQAMGPTSNPILVETDDDAKIVDFNDVWPAARDGGMGRNPGFNERGFKGEEKLTSAILRATHKEQTAVVFVHFGGPPLFFGGMQGLPPAPYAQMKQVLEDANFMVSDWDLKAAKELPALDPKPTRIIFIVLKPTPPQQGQFGQPPQEPAFSEVEEEALLSALKENPRAMFIAGWHPGQMGPMGPMPGGGYEFNDYLEKEWGLKVDTGILLMKFRSVGPGQYMADRGTGVMQDVELADHVIVSRLHSDPMMLPSCCPLTKAPAVPGVTLRSLVTAPGVDGLWGVKDLNKYREQLPPAQDYFTKVEGDLDGPFDLAVAGEKGSAKMVVVASSEFATDEAALSPKMMMTSQGIAFGIMNPGNSALFINALHWLNDNESYMNLGKPIQMQTIQVPGPGTVKTVHALAMVGWPLAAVAAGLVVMFIRRR